MLLLAVAALTAAGCNDTEESAGGEPAPPPTAEVRAALTGFEAAFQAGEATKACSLLTPAARARVIELLGSGSGGCRDTLSEAALGFDEREQRPFEILDVELDGDRATVTISDAGRPPVPIRVVEAGGEWRVATLGLSRAAGSPPG